MKHAYTLNQNELYFDELPKSTQELVKECLVETIKTVEGWRDAEEDLIDEVECRQRDGFIPFSHNHGGLEATQYTDLNQLYSSGIRVAHKRAQAEIDRQIEYSMDCAKESFFEYHKDALQKIGITSIEDASLNYHALCDLNQSKLAESLSECETEALCGDDGSIMFQVRFLYHGKENGIHSASVSCAVNTEGPYHRSHISWSPNTFCEGAKEVEISWRTESGLKRQLVKALKQTSEDVF